MDKKVVIVEGIIGAGKSILSKELGGALGDNTLIMMEPDEKEDANPYLSDYYTEPERWSFTLQVHMLAMRYRMHLNAQWHAMSGVGHAVLDRSYFGDTAFARLQVNDGIMSEREFSSYSKIYQAMTASVLLPSVCIRLLVSPEVAHERINKRMEDESGRKCESGIPMEYLVNLDKEIDHMCSVLKGMGVNVIDMPWDVMRETPADRKGAVHGLARRIEGLEPIDTFLDMHRRKIN